MKVHTHYSYRYVRARDRKPLLACPECKADLSKEEHICLDISVCGQEVSLYTRLDQEGNLIDVNELVWSGYHSATSCGICHTSLMARKGVVEVERRHACHEGQEPVRETETES